MTNVITVDGVAYPHVHVMSLKRSFSVLDGPNAGRVMTYEMIRDVGGTFYNYTLEFDPELSSATEYDTLYEVLSAPVESHSIVVPYGQSTLTFQAYVTSGEDTLAWKDGSVNHWDGLSINFIAMAPQRRPA